jgi:hypothetical protein
MDALRYPNPDQWISGPVTYLMCAMLYGPPTTHRWRVHWNRRSKPSIGARRRAETKK